MLTIGFGSCNQQWQPQHHWPIITNTLLLPTTTSSIESSLISSSSSSSLRKDDVRSLWLWMGDNVYAKNRTLQGLTNAYANLTQSIDYSLFRSPRNIVDDMNVDVDVTNHNYIQIEGTWDDHDYGINDGGKDIDNYVARRQMFLDFINLPNVDEQSIVKDGYPLGAIAREREINRDSNKNNKVAVNSRGVYYSIDTELMIPGNPQLDVADHTRNVKVIFLDTRSFRSDHYIKSLAERSSMSLMAILAAAVRASSALLALGRNYSGDMLGEEQWQWLEQTLASSTADFHIIVSSVQVLTSSPVYESWGHFPVAKARLLDLLKTFDPPGLVILSGDVHHAEISVAEIERHDGTKDVWHEVTSSGLTHSCMNGITKFVCPWLTSTFSSHRKHVEDLFLGLNFGLITGIASSPSTNGTITDSLSITIMDLVNQRAALSVQVPSVARAVWNPIVSVFPKEFPHLSESSASDLLANLLLMIGVMLALALYIIWSCCARLLSRKEKNE